MTAQDEQIAAPAAPVTAERGLLLDSLRIQGFRGFRDLQIARLGRVNLIVGQNNVGKTALLEALRLYASGGSPGVLWALLDERNELRLPNLGDRSDGESRMLALRYLFYQRAPITRQLSPLTIGSLAGPGFTMQVQVSGDNGSYTRQTDLVVRKGDQEIRYSLDDGFPSRKAWDTTEGMDTPYTYIPATGLRASEANLLWDRLLVTSAEDDVIQALQIITPAIQRLNFVDPQPGAGAPPVPFERIAVVKLAGSPLALPLHSFGDGMSRAFGIGLGLVNAQAGLALIDEIDSGLYHGVQTELWRLIFRVARRLNVQVFATTHSRDCLESFTKAAIEDTESDGVLISLRYKKGTDDVQAVLFDEEDLEIVTHEQIEIR